MAEARDRGGHVRWRLKLVYGELGVSGQAALVRQVLSGDALPRR